MQRLTAVRVSMMTSLILFALLSGWQSISTKKWETGKNVRNSQSGLNPILGGERARGKRDKAGAFSLFLLSPFLIRIKPPTLRSFSMSEARKRDLGLLADFFLCGGVHLVDS